MADVQYMKQIFTTKLKTVLDHLTIKTKEEIERK